MDVCIAKISFNFAKLINTNYKYICHHYVVQVARLSNIRFVVNVLFFVGSYASNVSDAKPENEINFEFHCHSIFENFR